jgi:hypothetical protein
LHSSLPQAVKPCWSPTPQALGAGLPDARGKNRQRPENAQQFLTRGAPTGSPPNKNNPTLEIFLNLKGLPGDRQMSTAQTGFSLIKTTDGSVRFATIIPRTGGPPTLYIADHKTLGPVSFNLDGVNYITQGLRIVLIGASGAGKSYALGVLAEEIHRAAIPFCVFDQEGEYAGLSDLPGVERIQIDNPSWDSISITDFVLREGGGAILDVDELDLEDQRQVFVHFASHYFALAHTIKRRNFLLIDESSEIAPQAGLRGKGTSRTVLERIARRGRKRGINTVLATQRPSELSKGVLAQANVKFIGRLDIINDYDAVYRYLSKRLSMHTFTQLETGQFICDLPGTSEIVHIRPRQTQDLGGTPTA